VTGRATDLMMEAAVQAVERCRVLAGFTEEPGFITRTFLSAPMHDVHRCVRQWMESAGLQVRIDAAGNIRGRKGSRKSGCLYIGSHLDTVPRAGAYDGILGVVLGIGIAGLKVNLPIDIEVIGFSEEEGVRFGVPFPGSLALIGELQNDLLARRDAAGISVQDAIRNFGLDPSGIAAAVAKEDALGYFEVHIEQGPVLESLDLRLGVVESIIGQSRFQLTFQGQANHAGTTPMHLRHDALAGAAEWIAAVEREARMTEGLVATVGQCNAAPGAGNVIAGTVQTSLDVRHSNDRIRQSAADRLLQCAKQIAERRGLAVNWITRLEQPSVAMNPAWTDVLAGSVHAAGFSAHRMHSGAGHDAMIVARRMPTAMLFLRSPGGISHHPDESVRLEDVEAALAAGCAFVAKLGEQYA